MTYDLQLKLVKEKVKGKKKVAENERSECEQSECEERAKRVLIQLPAGLRNKFLEIARVVKEEGAEPIIWAGPCYGACDLPNYECDLLLHFGHEEFVAEH